MTKDGLPSKAFWSPMERDWRGLGEFEPGQFVQGRSGLVGIASTEKLSDRQRLYNVEIDGEHVYEVTALGILVHNNDPLCEELLRLRNKSKTEGKLSDIEAARLNDLEAQVKAPKGAPRPFGELIKDAGANPSKWQVVKKEVAASTNMRNKGGTSVQELLRNTETGEEIVRHTLLKPDGTVFEPSHFRPFWK